MYFSLLRREISSYLKTLTQKLGAQVFCLPVRISGGSAPRLMDSDLEEILRETEER